MNVQLCLGLASLFVFGHAVEPPDQNPGKLGQHFEGDILVTNASGVKSGDRAFIGNENWLWPDGNVYYRLASTIKANHSRTSMITEAMADITREAPCVNFIDVEEAGVNIFSFVDIVTHGDMKLEVSGLGCHSEVGYQGRRQILNLQPDDCFKSATIKHELFHSLGCVHEHSRPDVAEALEVFVNNIKPNLRSNFRVEKYDYDDADKGVFTFNTPYDVMSIMQYPSNAFAFNDSLKTMQAKDPAFRDSFGYSDDFSVIDIVELNARYNCTMTTGLVFEYVNSYMDIMLSRRRMDQSAIAQLKEQHELDQNRTKELEEKIEKLENQTQIDKNALTKLQNEIKIDQDRRITHLENLILNGRAVESDVEAKINSVLIEKGVIGCENETQCDDNKKCLNQNDGMRRCQNPCERPEFIRCEVPYSVCVTEEHEPACSCKEDFHGDGTDVCIPDGFNTEDNKRGYRMFDEEYVEWEEALAKCASLGARLPVLSDLSTINIVKKYLETANFSTFAEWDRSSRRVWIGLQHDRAEGLLWMDGQRIPSYPASTRLFVWEARRLLNQEVSYTIRDKHYGFYIDGDIAKIPGGGRKGCAVLCELIPDQLAPEPGRLQGNQGRHGG